MSNQKNRFSLVEKNVRKGFMKILQLDANTIQEQLRRNDIYDEDEANKSSIYVAYLISIFYVLKLSYLVIVRNENSFYLLNDWSELFGDGRVFVLITHLIWSATNLLVRSLFLLRRNDLSKALNILEENEYRHNSDYFDDHNHDKLNNIEKWSLRLLNLTKIPGLLGVFFISFKPIKWSLERWKMIIFNDILWCISGAICSYYAAGVIIVTNVLFVHFVEFRSI